ncbi:MAG: hypothetical protein KAJ93_02425 [Methanosarcinales archaeon]|nr:hypothetical protein [Methanosarcinales archaeon]
MTIDLEGCTILMDSHIAQRKACIEEAKKELEEHETRVRELTEFIMKENYHIDKFSKVTQTIQMDRNNDKPFDEIHPRLFEVKNE